MMSSEDNRVSIPPKRSEIGLSDDRSCISSQKLAFILWCNAGFVLETGTGT